MGVTSRAGERELRASCRAIVRPGFALALLLAAVSGCGTRGTSRPADDERAARPSGARAASGGIHEVQRGDTLWSISRRHGIGVDELR